MDNILERIISKKQATKIDEDRFEIKTQAQFTEGTEVKIFLKRINGRFYLSDEKHTLRFMSKKYDLKSPDVKSSIEDIVRFYNFKIEKGELLGEISHIDDVKKRYHDMLICSCTLANMFIFFEPIE